MCIANTLQTLFKRYGDLQGVFIEVHKDLVAIGINNAAAKAEIFLQGAQIARYQPHQQTPKLFLSEANDFREGSPLRGGIPICWPWFGELARNPQQIRQQFPSDFIQQAPAHGLVRDKQWQVKNITTPQKDLSCIELELNLEADHQWPFNCELLLTVEVGKELRSYLQVTNTDTKRFFFSSALHTYFAVNGIDQTEVSGLDGAHYQDALQDWAQNTQQGTVKFTEEVDRVFEDCQASIAIKQAGTATLLDSVGSRSCVVWNPWKAKSATLSRFLPDDYKKMVCVETANIGNDSVTLEPGASHTLGLVIQ